MKKKVFRERYYGKPAETVTSIEVVKEDKPKKFRRIKGDK